MHEKFITDVDVKLTKVTLDDGRVAQAFTVVGLDSDAVKSLIEKSLKAPRKPYKKREPKTEETVFAPPTTPKPEKPKRGRKPKVETWPQPEESEPIRNAAGH